MEFYDWVGAGFVTAMFLLVVYGAYLFLNSEGGE